jgi:penicillin amidase
MAVRIRRIGNIAGALVAAGLLMFVLGAGYGPIPSLGRALVPGSGVWAASANANVSGQTPTLAGLSRPAAVSFTSQGYATVRAATDDDLFLAQGYVTATQRFSEMDLERRAGEGLLSQLDGASQESSDEFELQLGLARTAQAEWAAMPKSSEAARALTAYARGVNDYLAQVSASGRWPAIYALTGVRPAPWTPVDSLVVQEVLTQELDFSTTPLDYQLLEQSLGPQLTMSWFPVQAVTSTSQQPYDPGPYTDAAPTRFATGNAAATRPASETAADAPAASSNSTPNSTATASGASSADNAILAAVRDLPATERNLNLDSNAWAVDGPLAAGGKALLAGDPHLQLALPSFWFEVSLSSPGYDVSGGSVPGMPAIVVGYNAHVSWSITNTENQSTLFYDERTDAAHPNSYYWDGAWRPMQQLHYSIPVRGAASIPLTVDSTVHGPVMTMDGQTVSVTWMGDYPSDDLTALLDVGRATDFTGFRSALQGWHAPTVNFVYADKSGNIGAVSTGYFPQMAPGSQPWLPMSGTGADDVVGTIPFAQVPQVYDPPSHVVASTNQRPVADDYPYYIGTSLDFDPGYRETVILSDLRGHAPATASSFAALQQNTADALAESMVPALLRALDGTTLTATQQAARDELASWNDAMDADSAAASVWWNFLQDYLSDVFQPWWNADKVPVSQDPGTLDLSNSPIPLREALQQWTLQDPDNSAFTPPGSAPRDAADVMRTAFASAVDGLATQFGGAASSWTWGRLHSTEIPSITGVNGLGNGPVPSGGDGWTVDAADGGLVSDFGPSWRMVVDWSGPAGPTATAIYPGGQSDDPTSAWYANLLPIWFAGQYLPLGPSSGSGSALIIWNLRAGS